MDLGLERAGWTPIAFCEHDEYCRRVLARHWPDVPCIKDVREITAWLRPLRRIPVRYHEKAKAMRAWLSGIDAVVGGFPCQDISSAGKGAGLDGARSGLWWEMRRVIALVRPRWVVAENVPALRTRGVDKVLESLEGSAYAGWPIVVGADSLGAPHKRKRVFIIGLGDPDRYRVWEQRGIAGGDRAATPVASWGHERLGDTGGTRRERDVHDAGAQGREDAGGSLAGSGGDTVRGYVRGFPPRPDDYTRWRMVLQLRPGLAPSQAEPGVCRAPHGVSIRVARRHWRDQLRSLGNAVVPAAAEMIGRAIVAFGRERSE